MLVQYLKYFALGAVFVISGCSNDPDSDNSDVDLAADAQYKVEFQANWNNISFPTNHPGSSAHFSGLIGTTHNSNTSFWSVGSLASAGVKSVAETGKKTAFKAEIAAEKTNNNAEYMLDGGGIGSGTASVSIEFSVNKDHSLVTLISMIAPSPDWFVGVQDLDLYDQNNNDWFASKTVNLASYDAGTDSGATFKSSDSATSPQENISLLTSNPANTDFVNGVQSTTMEYIGTFTFTKLN
jgi:hypothetical protein